MQKNLGSKTLSTDAARNRDHLFDRRFEKRKNRARRATEIARMPPAKREAYYAEVKKIAQMHVDHRASGRRSSPSRSPSTASSRRVVRPASVAPVMKPACSECGQRGSHQIWCYLR